jgi:hypothetical protein
MSIPFDDDLSALAVDLERAGYGQPRVLKFPYTPARRIELHLRNGLVVNWDRIECVLFVEGPLNHREQMEHFLELRDERGLRRAWAFYPAVFKAAAVGVLLLGAVALAAIGFSQLTESGGPAPLRTALAPR